MRSIRRIYLVTYHKHHGDGDKASRVVHKGLGVAKADVGVSAQKFTQGRVRRVGHPRKRLDGKAEPAVDVAVRVLRTQ